MPIPKIREIPRSNKPSIKSQSTSKFADKLSKNGLNGPYVANLRKPAVGDEPESQVLSGVVANPKPNNLSKKAQRKVHPIARRSTASKRDEEEFFIKNIFSYSLCLNFAYCQVGIFLKT